MLHVRGVVVGARVVDLYAGTGALGLEALSRGAAFATFVESDRRALEALTRNIDVLRERPRSRVVFQPAQLAATTLAGDEASLVFCDPPYADVASGAVAKILLAFTEHQGTRAGATLVLEHATRDAPGLDAARFRSTEQRAYGDTTLTFYDVIAPAL